MALPFCERVERRALTVYSSATPLNPKRETANVNQPTLAEIYRSLHGLARSTADLAVPFHVIG